MRGNGRILTTAIGLVAFAFGASEAVAQQQFKCGKTGGELIFAQEAKANSLDMHASSAIATRNIAMNIFESLMTRDEVNNPIPELADTVTESPDKLTYTFKLRNGIKFHNGKEMSSADVIASFNRYAKLGLEKATLNNVEGWDAPDKSTFVIKMKSPQPTFIEELSSFSVPIVITPSENTTAEALRMTPIGTGPFQFVEFVPDSHVKLRRFDAYSPNINFKDRTGFGGYKVACVDAVTFRIVTEAGARAAGIESGDFHAVEDLPAKSAERLKSNTRIVIKPYENFWIHIATPNFAKPPTDNPLVRRAIATALDMKEIMEAATDGAYNLNYGFQQPNRIVYSDLGKEFFNVNDQKKAQELLKQAGYKGEELVLLTNKDYQNMYNAALVMAEQLKAIGMKVRLEVTDWPTTINRRDSEIDTWNYHFTGWGTNSALGAIAVLKFLAPPNPIYFPIRHSEQFKDKQDPVFAQLWNDMTTKPTFEERKAAFGRAQYRVMEHGMALPFGWLTKYQAVRSNVQNFVPFRIPRIYNVWIEG
jgi:peptide/nickel transport system substrate-binding protein